MIALISTLAAFAAGIAQEPQDDRPVLRLTIYGSDACPPSSEERIVVCARRPETERHRIPQELREDPDRAERSWAERAESLETVGDTGPQSCSTVGPGGFTGCREEMIREARRERARAARRNQTPPR